MDKTKKSMIKHILWALIKLPFKITWFLIKRSLMIIAFFCLPEPSTRRRRKYETPDQSPKWVAVGTQSGDVKLVQAGTFEEYNLSDY